MHPLGPTVDRLSRHDIHVRLACADPRCSRPPLNRDCGALEELTVTAAQYVPGAQYAGITVTTATVNRHPERDRTISRTTRVIQERHHEGPSLQAVRQHRTVRVDDLDTDTRWPIPVRCAGPDPDPLRVVLRAVGQPPRPRRAQLLRRTPPRIRHRVRTPRIRLHHPRRAGLERTSPRPRLPRRPGLTRYHRPSQGHADGAPPNLRRGSFQLATSALPELQYPGRWNSPARSPPTLNDLDLSASKPWKRRREGHSSRRTRGATVPYRRRTRYVP